MKFIWELKPFSRAQLKEILKDSLAGKTREEKRQTFGLDCLLKYFHAAK